MHPRTKDEGEARLGEAGVEDEGRARERRRIREAILDVLRVLSGSGEEEEMRFGC